MTGQDEESLGLGAKPQTSVDQCALGQDDQLVAQRRRRSDHDTPESVERLGACLDRTGTSDAQRANHLDHPGLGFRDRRRGLAQHGPGDLLGVETVGLAVHSPGQPVGPVHLDYALSGPRQRPCQGRAERAGALDADRHDLAVATHPGQQLLVAMVERRELLVTEQATVFVNDGGVVGVFVGVDATDDSRGFGCHAGIRSSVRCV